LIELADERATRELARHLVATLPAGNLILLRGPLGAGKTTLARYVALELGFEGRVTSPTYTLMHTYPTPAGPVLHVDVYRLPDPRQIYDLGLDEAAATARLTLIEWGEPKDFPGALEVELQPVSENVRQVTLRAHDPRLQEIARRVTEEMQTRG